MAQKNRLDVASFFCILPVDNQTHFGRKKIGILCKLQIEYKYANI